MSDATVAWRDGPAAASRPSKIRQDVGSRAISCQAVAANVTIGTDDCRPTGEVSIPGRAFAACRRARRAGAAPYEENITATRRGIIQCR